MDNNRFVRLKYILEKEMHPKLWMVPILKSNSRNSGCLGCHRNRLGHGQKLNKCNGTKGALSSDSLSSPL